jgi:hypothetical protein
MNQELQKLHDEAMEVCDRADALRRDKDIASARSLYRRAMEMEREAATRYLAHPERQGATAGILLRSAASLAWEARDLEEAERLIALGLSDVTIPESVREELRDLYEQVNFDRHLRVRGRELSEDEIQLSLSGPGVNFGMVAGEDFFRRGEVLQSLLYRTAERLSGREYRRGAVPPELRERFAVYLSVPRAASFAVTYRLATVTPQLVLEGMTGDTAGELPEPARVLGEVQDLLQIFEEGWEDQLARRLPEPYLKDFMGAARRLAPDGERVTQVGLTSGRGRAGVALRRVASRNPATRRPVDLVFRGRLIKLEEKIEAEMDALVVQDRESGREVRLFVKDSLEYVPLFKRNVAALARRYGDRLYLERVLGEENPGGEESRPGEPGPGDGSGGNAV